jgi:hypothetical protein
MLSLLSI